MQKNTWWNLSNRLTWTDGEKNAEATGSELGLPSRSWTTESFLLEEVKAEELQSLWLDNCDTLKKPRLEINREDITVLNAMRFLQAMSLNNHLIIL